MKYVRLFPRPRLPFPLRSVPALPITLVKSVALTLSRRKSPVTTEDDSITRPSVDIQTQTQKRPLITRILRTRGSSTANKAAKGQEVPQLADLIDHNIETIISLHMHAELKVGRHQRILERMTAFLGRPPFFYMTLFIVSVWIVLNLLGSRLHLPVFDPAPFSWLQGIVGLGALLMTILVLTTQNRQAKFAERSKHLDLQVNLVVEHKVSKLIALVEELRRDMPTVKNRYDQEAEAMSEAVDPQAVFLALDETLAEVDPDEDQMVIQSDFVVNVETSLTTEDFDISSSSE